MQNHGKCPYNKQFKNFLFNKYIIIKFFNTFAAQFNNQSKGESIYDHCYTEGR